MGTSVQMMERSYATLLDGADAGIGGRLDAHDAEGERADADVGRWDALARQQVMGAMKRRRAPRTVGPS